MRLNKRETFMLWKLLEFSLHRYLLATHRRNGCDKAERHIEFSKTLWEVLHAKTATPEDHRGWMHIHDEIAHRITNDMDKTISFDLDEEEPDWDILTDRLFRRITKFMETYKASGQSKEGV